MVKILWIGGLPKFRGTVFYPRWKTHSEPNRWGRNHPRPFYGWGTPRAIVLEQVAVNVVRAFNRDVVALDQLLAELGQTCTALGVPTLPFRDDRLSEQAVHLVDRQPGAAVGHIHRPCGGDRPMHLDIALQPDLAGADLTAARKSQLHLELGVGRGGRRCVARAATICTPAAAFKAIR